MEMHYAKVCSLDMVLGGMKILKWKLEEMPREKHFEHFKDFSKINWRCIIFH